MSRYLILLVLIFSIVGCGNGGAQAVSSNAAPDSVTFDKPTEEKSGTVTMADLCKTAGIKAYPGTENESGDVFKRSDGGLKDEITFTTSDPMAKVAQFFKDQGLDTNILADQATTMAATKTNAQLIISYKPTSDGKCEVVVKSLHYDQKSP
ncbi:MAG: hypothetical protein GC165_15890 [Armatimonadetes bacterium]|nr:hypothetical protein [Armatimonadota bacterium]